METFLELPNGIPSHDTFGRVFKELELLMLKDAMGCQTKIAEKIIGAGADYVLAVKENQGTLHRDIEWLFEIAQQANFKEIPHDHLKTVNKKGRIEVRQCWSISDTEHIEYLQKHQDWKNLKTIAMVETEFRRGDQVSRQRRYYISSLDNDAETILHAVRTHWQIENSLNWSLDVTFREDDSRVRKGAGPQNLAVLRRLALSLLKREASVKRSIQGKRFLAGWDNDYLLKILVTP